MIFDRY